MDILAIVLGTLGFVGSLVSTIVATMVKSQQDKRLASFQSEIDMRIGSHQHTLDKQLDNHQLANEQLLSAHRLGLDKKLVEFKHQLEQQTAIDFERFRASLEVEMAENRWIREKRFGLVQELYSLLGETLFLLETSIAEDTGSPFGLLGGMLKDANAKGILDEFKALAESITMFHKAYMKNRIILAAETCLVVDEIDNLAGKMILPTLNALIKSGYQLPDYEQREKLRQSASLLNSKSITLVAQFREGLKLFENEARSILPLGNAK